MKLTKVFGIPRTGEVIVSSGTIMNGNIGSVIKQDGHSAGDLYAITIEKMQDVLGADKEKSKNNDFYKLFERVVNNIEEIEAGTYLGVEIGKEVEGALTKPKKKDKKAKSEKDSEDEDTDDEFEKEDE